MLQIDSRTVIYVICPSHIVTGGIEAVHQLVDQLRMFGHDAYIVPTPPVRNPVLLQYRNYDVRFANRIDDETHNILITTEVNPRALDPYQSIQKALWWLSVDNHEKLAERFDFESKENQDIIHFAQSSYAHAFLRQKGIKEIYPLTDYLHDCYFEGRNQQKRNFQVLYTPVKGAEEVVQQLMVADPSIQWLPLRGMIRKQHAQTLRRGRVYVDFGAHPGKDRQPREAVVNGCCVIVGRKGAACFQEDVPIPENYKFSCHPLHPATILETIKDCLAHYEQRRLDFVSYDHIVRQEEEKFGKEVREIFGIRSHRWRPHAAKVLANTFTFVRQQPPFEASRGLANEMLPLAISDGARGLYRQWHAWLRKK